MLNLDDKSSGSFDIRYMLLPCPTIDVHHFLTVNGKSILPVSVPIGLGLLPWIASRPGLMSPMPANISAALGYRVTAAETAFAVDIRCGFGSNTVYECQPHNRLTCLRRRPRIPASSGAFTVGPKSGPAVRKRGISGSRKANGYTTADGCLSKESPPS